MISSFWELDEESHTRGKLSIITALTQRDISNETLQSIYVNNQEDISIKL